MGITNNLENIKSIFTIILTFSVIIFLGIYFWEQILKWFYSWLVGLGTLVLEIIGCGVLFGIVMSIANSVSAVKNKDIMKGIGYLFLLVLIIFLANLICFPIVDKLMELDYEY